MGLRPFPKGVSGNPGGRPKGIAAKAREHADRAIEVLAEALADADPKVRIAAADKILDRGYGKPVTMTADVTDKLEDLDDATLADAIAVLRAAVGSSEEAGASAEAQTTH